MSVSAPDVTRDHDLRARVRDVLVAARGERADFAFWPLTALAIPAALAVAGLEGPNRVGPLTALLGGAVSVAVAVVTTLLLVRVLDVLRLGWIGTVSVWVLPGVAMGAARAAVVAALGDPHPEWMLRIAASGVASLIWVPVVVATVHLRRELAVRRAAFDDAQRRLTEVLALEADALRLGTDEVSGMLVTRLVPKLEALAAQARAAGREAAALTSVRARVVELLDTVVRPLSRHLGPEWLGPELEPAGPRGAVLHDVLRRPIQAPWLAAALIAAASALDVVRAAGWDVLVNGLLALVVACAVLDVVRALTARSDGPLGTVAQWSALVLIGIGVGLVPPLVDALSPEVAIARNLTAVFEYLPLVALGSVVASALRTQAAISRSTIRRLADATERLDWHTGEIVRRTGAVRPRAIRTLHGAVQSRLAATVLALSRPEAVGLSGADIADQLEASVRDIEAVAVPPGGDGVERLLAVPAAWRGVLDVSVDIEPSALDVLRQDADLGETAFDVVRECVVNSAKHGQAGAVRVRLEQLPDGVRVIADDDGRHPIVRDRAAHGVTAEGVRARGGAWTVTTGREGARAVVDIPRSPSRTWGDRARRGTPPSGPA